MTDGITGSAEFVRNVRRFASTLIPALAPTVFGEAAAALDAAQESVPRESGALSESAFVESPEVSPGRVVVNIGYSADYAAYEHEGFHGPAQVTPPKWLENAAEDAREQFTSAVTDAILTELERLGA